MTYLQRLVLRNFRNYEREEFHFHPKINLIEGGNAEGKTNLLEAIYLLSTGKSFRTLQLSDLIRMGQSAFFVEAHFVKDNIVQTLQLLFDGKQRKMQYNATSSFGFLNALGLLPSVIYAPEDIDLIIGSPAERRRFLDLHLVQSDPLYVYHLGRYYKAMKQRNHLLRQKDQRAIEPWEEMMALSGAYLTEKRHAAVLDLHDELEKSMHELSDEKDHLRVRYMSGVAPQDNLVMQFRAKYLDYRLREMAIGNTLIGPHRDDLVILINDKDAKTFASEGQKRCACAALRLAEWERLFTLNAAPPIMSIDDFGVHLDTKRSQFLHERVQNLGQVFITSPTALTPSGDHFHRFIIRSGQREEIYPSADSPSPLLQIDQ